MAYPLEKEIHFKTDLFDAQKQKNNYNKLGSGHLDCFDINTANIQHLPLGLL